MKILALELSTVRGSLAWLASSREGAGSTVAQGRQCGPRNEDVDRVKEWPNDRKNSGAFFDYLVSIRQKFGLPDTIIVGLGPGSYAGTRIAISAAIGLQAASGARLIGFPSICALECEANEYCVIGDARRQSFFFARIRTNDLVEGPTLFGEMQLRDKLDKLDHNMSIFVSEDLRQFKRTVVRYPSARMLAQLTQSANRNFALPPLEPIYLREPHITLPKTIPGIGIPADGDSQARLPARRAYGSERRPCHKPGS